MQIILKHRESTNTSLWGHVEMSFVAHHMLKTKYILYLMLQVLARIIRIKTLVRYDLCGWVVWKGLQGFQLRTVFGWKHAAILFHPRLEGVGYHQWIIFVGVFYLTSKLVGGQRLRKQKNEALAFAQKLSCLARPLSPTLQVQNPHSFQWRLQHSWIAMQQYLPK